MPETIGKPQIKEEFFLLCVLRFGSSLTYPADVHVFRDFREEIHPDYFNNGEIPILDLSDYLYWLEEKTHG